MSESQTLVQDQRCQSRPSARNSVIPVREDFQRIMGKTNNDCRFQILILTNSPREPRSLVGRKDSTLRYVLVHNFLTEAMLWIKEVELVDSVDDLKSSCSVRRIQMPNFEVLDVKITSAYLSLQSSRRIQYARTKSRRSLNEKFENHKHKESFLQVEKIDKFSKESQDLIADMNITEIFEHCENSPKQQCPGCNACWDMGIIYCSCGRNMKSTRSPTEFDQNKCDVVFKKNRSRGAKHGASESQKMHFHAKQMLKKARQGKHGGHPTILSRWYADDEYRKSLSDIGWREHHITLYDRIVRETRIRRRES